MPNMTSNERILVAVLMLSGLGAAICRAQPPAPPPPPSGPPPPPPRGGPPPPPALGPGGSRTTVSGVVRNFNYGPGGLDGLILDRGTVIHFPPEYANQASSVAPIGSAVSASGWSHIGPAGDTLFDAESITNQRTRASMSIANGLRPPPGPPDPPPPPPPPAGYAAPPPPPPNEATYAQPEGPQVPMPAAPMAQATVI